MVRSTWAIDAGLDGQARRRRLGGEARRRDRPERRARAGGAVRPPRGATRRRPAGLSRSAVLPAGARPAAVARAGAAASASAGSGARSGRRPASARHASTAACSWSRSGACSGRAAEWHAPTSGGTPSHADPAEPGCAQPAAGAGAGPPRAFGRDACRAAAIRGGGAFDAHRRGPAGPPRRLERAAIAGVEGPQRRRRRPPPVHPRRGGSRAPWRSSNGRRCRRCPLCPRAGSCSDRSAATPGRAGKDRSYH